MHPKRSLAFVLFVGLLAVTLSGCGLFGSKQAATPAEQALMDTGERLKEVSAEYVKTNAAYVAKCGAPRSLDAATCDAWVRYTSTFVKDYAKADADWRAARLAGDTAGQASVDARVKGLAATLQTYTDKTK